MKNKRFWFWNKKTPGESDKRTLFFNGTIAEESWFDDDITPKMFKEELEKDSGDIDIWINSPGGDCIAAAQIYNMLMDYQGHITVKVDGIAASAASVIAMAGDEVLMSPVSMLMIHNPMTIAIGDEEEMTKAYQMLLSVKASIINAYEKKTGLSREELSNLMDAETWMDVNMAKEYGFCDGLLERKETSPSSNRISSNAMIFSRRAVTNSLLEKLRKSEGKPVSEVLKRLETIKTNWR